jgi:hypothetical protein
MYNMIQLLYVQGMYTKLAKSMYRKVHGATRSQ